MGKGHRTCEVCGAKERSAGDKSLLFSKFPLEPSRCREWLKAVGNEELVHLPIEKLHDQRNVCANHFRRQDFNKKGNRLKRHAIPTLRLMAVRLSDSQLAEFPLHVGLDKRVSVPQQVPSTSQHDRKVLMELSQNGHTPITEDQGDDSMNYDDDPLRPMAEAWKDSTIEDKETDRPPGGTDECYFCNVCKESIKGFRYTCVQCEDWDLCGACEARAAHAMHYVLRIPSPRPYKEIQEVLTAVRQQLINQKILPGKADSVKEEPISGPEDATEPDTLDWAEDFYEKDNICIELEDGEHPPRKQLHPEASSNHSNQDLKIPKSPKPTHDHTTDIPFNHDVTNSSKDIQPGLMRLTGTTPQTTGTLLPTRALNNPKKTLTIKPISRLPLGARVVKLSACFGKPAISIKKGRVHRRPRKLLHPGPLRTPSDQDLTTPKSSKPTHDRTTYVHFNQDLTNYAKDIQPATLSNDTPTIPKPGLNRLIGTMQQPTGTSGTLLQTRAVSNSRTTLTLKPIPRLPLGSKVVKRTIIVGNSSSRLSEEKTEMSSPSMDKSSCQRPDHASAVTPTTAITTLERAAMSDPKDNSN